MKLLNEAIDRTMVKERFLSNVLLRLPLVEDKNVPILATKGDDIRFNPEGLEAKLPTREEKIFGVLHETMHVILRHPFRFRRMPGLDHQLANIAMDYEVNLLLEEIHSKTGNFFSMPEFILLDHKWKEMVWEEIYAKLAKDGHKPQSKPGKGQPGKDGQQPGIGCGSLDVQPFQGDEGKAVEAENRIIAAVAQAQEIAKSAGSVPAGLAQKLGQLNEPQIPWQNELMHLASQVVRDDFCWRKPNKKYLQTGFTLPSLHSEKLGWLVIARDTSGSMGPSQLNGITSEARGILEQCKPARLTVIDCDCAIEKVIEIEEGNESSEWDGEVSGGGGTVFQPVLDWIAEQGEEPLMLIYMTDGYPSEWPKTEPSYPVTWLLTNKETNAPWGKVVRILT
jgi:predicted metal-dependent peptidase